MRYVFTLEWTTVIWLKSRKYRLAIRHEIIEVSDGFYVARLSSKQYGRNDNLSYMARFQIQKGAKANKAIFLPPLTYWLKIHVASRQCIHPIVLHSIHLLVIILLSINLGYPSAFYIFLVSWSRVSWSWNSVNIVYQHLVLFWNRIDNVASVMKVAFPYFGI